MKITRTLILLANLARMIPVNPVMLVDVAYHASEHGVAIAVTDRPGAGGVPAAQVAEALLVKEAWLVEGLRTSRS